MSTPLVSYDYRSSYIYMARIVFVVWMLLAVRRPCFIRQM